MNKKDLRKKYFQLRKAVALKQGMEESIQIANQLLQLPIWDFEYYHIFVTITDKNEIDTSSIFSILQGKDKNIVLPKMNTDNTLTNFLLTDSTLIKNNHYNVPEPQGGIEIDSSKIDVVFVPLLAYDKEGNRIGYGKGFYDRFLEDCKPNVVKIGLSFFPPEENIDDVNPLDIPLDYCVTPTKTYQFGN